jgi:hypothetical protein
MSGMHGPNDGLFLKTANSVTGGIIGMLQTGVGCFFIFALLGLVLTMKECVSNGIESRRSAARYEESKRLDREHPDMSCRDDLQEVRTNQYSDSITSTYRDTISGVPFREWIATRSSSGTRRVVVYWPRPEMGTYDDDNCGEELVEYGSEGAAIEVRSDSMAPQYHALLTRLGVAHTRHRSAPLRRIRTTTSTYIPPPSTAEWDACVRTVSRREMAGGESLTFAAGVAAIECAPLKNR